LASKKIVSIWNNYLRTFEEKGKVIFAEDIKGIQQKTKQNKRVNKKISTPARHGDGASATKKGNGPNNRQH